VYCFGFQEQEQDEELWEGAVSFKYRLEDPRLGRFFSVDPLTRDYPEFSPFSFSGNMLLNAREIEGLEPGIMFKSMDNAAENWAKYYNDNSIRIKQELGSTIYKTKDAKGVVKYAYSIPNVGESGYSVVVSKAPSGSIPVADIHSHGQYTFGLFADNEFSGVQSIQEENLVQTYYDIGDNNKKGLVGYLSTPSGNLQKYNPATGKVKVLNNSNPSDPNDPSNNKIPSHYENFIKLGSIEFNSDKSRGSKQYKNVMIVKDLHSGKDYGVVRMNDGSYQFFNGKNNEASSEKRG
jgi:hypothetical protein